VSADHPRRALLRFQASAETYVPRETHGTLEELLTATDRLQAGEPFSEAIDRVLDAGSSVGGARPRATVTSADGRASIAKFSTTPTRSRATDPRLPDRAVRRCGGAAVRCCSTLTVG